MHPQAYFLLLCCRSQVQLLNVIYYALVEWVVLCCRLELRSFLSLRSVPQNHLHLNIIAHSNWSLVLAMHFAKFFTYICTWYVPSQWDYCHYYSSNSTWGNRTARKLPNLPKGARLGNSLVFKTRKISSRIYFPCLFPTCS